MTEPETRSEIILNEFSKAGIYLTDEKLQKFVLLDELLEKHNEKADLTRIESPLSVVVNHYVDSVLASELINVYGPLLDVGTGAGFPGIPMAIMNPERKIILAESRLKKLEFMEMVINVLKLKNVEFYPHKIGPNSKLNVHSMISRDFKGLETVVPLVSHLIPPGGYIFHMTKANIDRELELASKVQEFKLFSVEKKITYELKSLGQKRKLLILKKSTEPSEKESSPLAGAAGNNDNITEIASSVNSKYKGWLRLLSGGKIKKTGETLIFGKKILKDMIANFPEMIRAVIARRREELEGFGFSPGVPVYLLRRELFPRLDVFGTGPPVAVAGLRELPDWNPQEAPKNLTLFAPIQDPLNVGAVIRTAAATGTDLVLLEEAANPFHPKALRASGPAVYGARIFKGPSLKELSRMNLPYLMALSPRGRNIYFLDPPEEPLGLVLGLEGPGLDEYWPKEKRISIPMKGNVESLNVSVAAAMAIAILRKEP
jgi:16S rRNA (guanine527-N7)-methyltransferase